MPGEKHGGNGDENPEKVVNLNELFEKALGNGGTYKDKDGGTWEVSVEREKAGGALSGQDNDPEVGRE